MKKLVSILFALGLIFPLQAFALVGFGLDAGYASWSQSGSGSINGSNLATSDKSPGMTWVEVQHPIPLVPNVRIATSTFDAGNSTDGLSIGQSDFIAFYNLWDTIATVDVGLGVRSMATTVTSSGSSTNLSLGSPLIYYNLAAKIPGIPLRVGYRSSGFSASGLSLADTELYVNYSFALGLGVTVGTRSESLKFNDSGYNVNTSADGMFIGVEYRLD